MWEINWKKFEIKNPKATEAFETLCYFLFCRKFNITEGIRTDFNQVGLETEPVKDSNGEYWGFQSKFFDKKINYNNMLVEMSTSDRKIAEKFCDLKNYNKKVCLVPFEMNCKYAVKLEMLPEQKEFWQTANETAVLGVDTYNFSIIDLCNGIIKHRYL